MIKPCVGSARRTSRGRCGSLVLRQSRRTAYFEALENRVLLSAAGLVAAYSFNEGTGTVAHDSSGLGNDGILLGSTWSSSGKYGGALSFNGSSGLVNVVDSPSLDLTSGMTLEAWVDPTSLSGYGSIIYKQRTNGDAYALDASNNTNKAPIGFINTTGGSDASALAAAKLATAKWTFLSVTYDGSKLSIYMNGTLSKSTTVSGTIVTGTGALQFGGNSVLNQYFAGLIDEVRIYNRALSAAEIKTDMTTPVPDAPDTTPPSVVGLTPAPNAANVATTAAITATFSEPVAPATIHWTVTDSSSNPIAGTATYNAATNVATFTPSIALSAQTTYSVNLAGATDLAGNGMLSPEAWSFTTTTPDTTPPEIIVTSPASGAQSVLLTTPITATFSEPVQPSTISVVVRDDKQTDIPGTFTYNAQTATVTWTPTSSLVNNMTYSVIVSGALDLAGNQMDHDTWLFTTVPPGTGPFSLFSPTATPAVADDSDGNAVELGVKFSSDTAGYVTGIRFYKGPTNTGTHTGELWSSTGTLLAQATFTNESASGWQQVNFAQPVLIQANTTYVASYHTNVGHYSADNNYFLNNAINNAPLHAPASGATSTNGVYVYSSSAKFPTSSYASSNYWVDVAFTSQGVQGPLVISQTPASGAPGVPTDTSLSATFNESVQAGTINFQLLDGANNPVAGTAVYSDSTHTVTFVPNQSLNNSTTYTAIVSDAADSGGFTMATPATWSFTTAAAAGTGSSAIMGQWSSVINMGLVAINQVQLNDGRILMWDGGPDCIGSSSATVYDPKTGSFTPVPVNNANDDNDIFCSAAVLMADGRVAVIGGHDCTGVNTGIKSLNIFDPTTMTWTRGPDMTYARWYPTATVLSDGRILVTGGSDVTNQSLVPYPEVYDPVSNTWTVLTAAKQTVNDYAFMYVLPNGNVLEAGSDEAPQVTRELNVATQTWTTVDPTLDDGSSSVMYLPGEVLKAGASCPEEGAVLDDPSSASAYILNMNASDPQWVQTGSMANARTWLDLTMLPDGTVLATGGTRTLGGVDPTQAVLPAEIWNPATGQWTTVASMVTPRMYHSTATLLPDGRVLVAGGGENYVNDDNYPSAEIYSPSYLFNGPRPTITSVASNLQYGGNFDIATPDGASIQSVALIRTDAVTHAFDENQRYVPLTFTQSADGLSVTAPANANIAPPGYYMLFIVNSNGVPSIAPFVDLPVPGADLTPPNAPGNLQASGTVGGALLSWNASTDNMGVVGYNIYRSTTPTFTPGPATLVGQTTGTTYSDSVAPGTYYYFVEARDAANNLSAPSNAASATATAPLIHLVQDATNGLESSAASLSVTLPSSVKAGDFLIITGTAASPRESLTIKDSLGNTFVPAISAASDPNQDVTGNIWYVAVSKGGSDTFTITPAAADALEIHVSEWNGINSANPVDQTSFASGNSAAISAGTVTTTQDQELVFGYAFPQQNATNGFGFTGLSYVNGDLDEYQIQPAAGPVAATFTQQSDYWFAMEATFRAAVPDSQPPTPPQNPSAASATGSVTLSWNASTDNIGVVGYNIYRSTASGFTPGPSNLIGTTTTALTYNDAVPAGTYYYVIEATDAAGNLSSPSTQVTGISAADTTPPQVSITTPANNATVSGAISLTASASDDVGVTSVQYLLNNTTISGLLTTSPYSFSWSSNSASNGTYSLTARASDAAGNTTTSAPVTITVSNVVAVPNLVAWYNFNQGSGTTLLDSSTNGFNGTISNAAWTTGKSGDALSFNGTNSWVTINDATALHLTKGMTLEAWVDPASMSGWNAILLKERPNGLSYGLYGEDDTGKPPAGYIDINGTDYAADGKSVLSLNTWTHLATTYDGKTLKTYVNGVLVGSRSISGSIISSTGVLRIGGDSIWGEYFNGLIDDIRIYNTALTAAQIQADMNAPV